MQHFIGLLPFCGVKGLIWQQLYQLSSRLWEMPVRSDSYHENFTKKKSKATLKLVDTLVFIETPVPFPTQMWYLRARCNTIQTYQIGWFLWRHSLFRFFWWWVPCKAENLCRALGRNPAFCEAMSPRPCGSDWGPDWNSAGAHYKSSLSHAKLNSQKFLNFGLWRVCVHKIHYWWGAAVCA